jgi:septal ring factor EnvC (AmiA/AmiB activator)
MKFLKALFFLICVVAVVNVHAQSSSELKRQREKLNDELQQLNREYQETVNNKKTTLKQLNLLKRQINLREEKISNINTEVRNLDNQISENTNTVHSLQSQLDQLKKEYAAMVLFAYRNKSAYNKLMFIFASKDFNQAYKRLKYLQQFATYRERQAGYIEGKQKDLHVKIVQLDKTKEEKHTLLLDQEKEKATLGKEKNNQLAVVKDLSQHEGQLKKQLREVQKDIAAKNRAINNAIRREIEEAKRKAEEAERLAAAKARANNKDAPVPSKPVARKTTSEIMNATPEAARLSSSFLDNRGRLPWPVANGKINHGYGAYTIEGIRMDNQGYDIATNPGAPVRSVFEGEVNKVIDITGTFLVIIRHGEYFTVYSNLKSVSVSKGQKVSTKQVLGTVATDSSTGDTDVHFELWRGSNPVDPGAWLVDK